MAVDGGVLGVANTGRRLRDVTPVLAQDELLDGEGEVRVGDVGREELVCALGVVNAVQVYARVPGRHDSPGPHDVRDNRDDCEIWWTREEV